MRFTEHAILRRIAVAAGEVEAALAAMQRRGRPVACHAELRRWLIVLEAWDVEHPGDAPPSVPLLELEGPRRGTDDA